MTVKLFLVSLLVIFASYVMANDGMGDFPKNNNLFSNKIMKEECKKNRGENFAVSPLSLNMALSLVSNGAGNEVLAEFGKVLQSGSFSQKDMNIYNRNVLAQSKRLGAEKYYISNGVWVRGNYNKNFYLVAKNYYNADVFKLNNNSAEDINNWISGKTQGKIGKMIDKVSPSEKACIVNAVYFYSQWDKTFPPYKTNEEAEFYLENGNVSKCAMMSNQGKFKVVDYNKGKILILNLKGSSAMYFMLPPENMKLADYAKTLDFSKIIINDTEGEEEYKIFLPKFKIEYCENFNDILKVLGLKKAFSGGFDRLGEKGDFCISSVIHKATIGIDEKGCEASAATVVRMAGMTPPKKIKEISFDRPFAFALVDELNNLVIFEGLVYKP